MSLINQMLKDLEDRSKNPTKPNIVLSGLQSTAEYSDHKKFFDRIVIVALFFLITFFVFYFGKILFSHFKTKSAHYSMSVADVKPAAATESQAGNLSFSAANPALSPAVLTGITFQTQSNTTYLNLLLSHEVFYRIATDKNNQKIILTLEQTHLTTSLPQIDYSNSAIQNIEMENNQGDLQIILTMNPGAALQHVALGQTNKYPELQIEMAQGVFSSSTTQAAPQQTPIAKAEVTEKPAGPGYVRKWAVDMSAEEQYKTALSFVDSGEDNKAIGMLSELITKYPNFKEIRQSLVELLIKQDKRLEADRILELGLRKEAAYLPFVELRARLLADSGKVTQALEILTHYSPALAENPNYYALVAALYQRSGQPKLAAKIYEQLLAIQPSKAIWWMGFGIALDNIGRHNDAIEAFSRADNSSDLSPELRAYVETRMHDV